jgi:hypothetical protein
MPRSSGRLWRYMRPRIVSCSDRTTSAFTERPLSSRKDNVCVGSAGSRGSGSAGQPGAGPSATAGGGRSVVRKTHRPEGISARFGAELGAAVATSRGGSAAAGLERKTSSDGVRPHAPDNVSSTGRDHGLSMRSNGQVARKDASTKAKRHRVGARGGEEPAYAVPVREGASGVPDRTSQSFPVLATDIHSSAPFILARGAQFVFHN